MSPGHSSPISKERTVPVTAPTANSTAITFDQRRASSSAASSPRLSPRQLAIRVSAGNAIPSEASTMWNPSVKPIWLRAGSSCEAAERMRAAYPREPWKRLRRGGNVRLVRARFFVSLGTLVVGCLLLVASVAFAPRVARWVGLGLGIVLVL